MAGPCSAHSKKGAFRAPFYIGGSCRMTRLRLALRAVAASGSVVSLRSTRTCCRFESLSSGAKQKGAFNRFLHWWVVHDDSASPRPSGRRRKRLRCLTAFDPNLLQVRIVEFGAKQKGAFRAPFYIGSCRMTRLRLALRAVAASGSVVSLRSTRTCCRFESLSSAQSKKAPLGRLFYIGGSCRIRTCDQLIKSQLLYQLS